MKEIRGIGIQPTEINQKSKVQKQPSEGADFAAELEKTVAQLENMSHSIDALIQGNQTDSTEVSKGVEEVGQMIQSVQGLVDKISPDKPHKAGAKFAASQYEKMTPKKGS